MGRYRVEGVLGTGGMGCVYRALDEHLGRVIALKVMHAGMGAQVARFEREARAGATLTHPAAVRVLAYGHLEDTRPYLALEFVDGESLSVRLRRDGPLTVAQTLALLRPIAGTLAEAHGRGVVHRDLKPENLLCTRALGMPESLRLLDFGIAGLMAVEGGAPVEKLTVVGEVFGTPEYMAPEQAMGRATGPMTDVWAFGAVVTAMLTGRSPFTGAHVPEILFRVVNGAPEPLPPSTPRALVELVSDCLRKNPAERPRDGAALLARLEGVSADDEVAARPCAEADVPAASVPPLAGPDASSSLRRFVGGLGGPGRRSGYAVGGVAGAALGALLVGLILQAGGPETRMVDSAETAATAATVAGIGPPDAPAARRDEALTLLTAGRIPEAVQSLRSLFLEQPALVDDRALLEAVMNAFEGREGTPLAEIVAGPLAAQAQSRLLLLAASSDARVRWRAVRTLPPDTPEARSARLQALRQDLRVDDCEVRRHTLGELAAMGDASVIPDIRAVRSRFNFVENLCLGDADTTAIRRIKN